MKFLWLFFTIFLSKSIFGADVVKAYKNSLIAAARESLEHNNHAGIQLSLRRARYALVQSGCSRQKMHEIINQIEKAAKKRVSHLPDDVWNDLQNLFLHEKYSLEV